MTEGCGCERPAGLSLPTAESTEGKPQEWAADRDAVRTAETREITAETQFPADTLPKPHPDNVRSECKCTKQGNSGADRNNFWNGAFAGRQSNAEPSGRKAKITFSGRIS